MRLKRLQLSGFKSFARSTTLEFPGAVSAIVGPNGSGKSNVAESIRWVLGEQSLKSLRGKRGEDLIFHGSGKRAKMSKAQAELIFSDVDPSVFGFEEVRIARVVYRDSVNEYTINDSKVRLKDVVELILKLGLSRSSHNIIGQGESDKILLISPEERRSIMEHALGLEIYQFKRDEAEKKLNKTQENLRESKLLRREIAPHLKFLEGQTKKARASQEWREELRLLVTEYVGKMEAHISEQEREFKKESSPLSSERQILEREIYELQAEIARFDEQIDTNETADFSAIAEIEKKIKLLSLELGRTQGRLQTHEKISVATIVDTEKMMNLIDSLRADISVALEHKDMDIYVSTLEGILKQLDKFTMEFESGAESNEKTELSAQRDRLEQELRHLEEERSKIQEEISKRHRQTIKSQQETRALHGELAKKQKSFEEVKDKINSFSFAKEKIRLKREEFEHIRHEYTSILDDSKKEFVELNNAVFDDEAQRAVLRRIEKLKIKIEEAGGIDESVIREYEETRTRDEFLVSQINDLQEALEKTKKLVENLEVQIDEEFKGGLSTINTEFQKLFSTLFDGATASLELTEVVQAQSEDEDMGVKEEIQGLEIKISIPRKRIRSLHMLSGGERSLTSVALLFALTQVNPPPFLVLDEVDAALDEANSARFGKLLQELSQKTQLIIITHNRETMRHASALYGVTMGSEGISKLLSVKFEEAKELVTA